jgi:hypothetical protein
MKIALDFDDTYTRDPALWDVFILNAQQRGHDIRIVTFRKTTMRDPVLDALSRKMPVIYTGYQQKRPYCNAHDFVVDVWIDDTPDFIV